MACAFNISTDIDTLSFNWEGGNGSFTVTVDGNNSNSSFYIDNGNDYTWFTIERDRNTIIVRVDPYTEYDDGSNNREGFIRLIHNCDATKIAEVSIIQQGIEYGISADKYNITFPNLEESVEDITVTAKGGSKKFYVKSIKEYSKDPMTIDGQTIPIEIDYDNGLRLSIEDSTLHIHSYGRAFANEGNYYEITLAHRDYRYATCIITVSYEEEEKDISLSKSEITFDYLGRVSDEDGLDYVEIAINGSSGEYTDYGYTYGYPTDDEGEVLYDYSWLTITENPTSITIACDENCDADNREAVILVYEYTEGKIDEKTSKSSLSILQVANNACVVSVADSTITIPATIEAGETYTTTVRAYGGTKTCSGTINISDTWLKATMEQNTPTCLYTSYTITITPESNSETERTATITVTHADSSSVQGVITIIQRGTNSDDYGIKHIDFSENNDQIIVSVSPETDSPQITMASTATWCSLSQNATTITVTCDTNNWNLARKCGLTLSNALNPINELHYLVTQKENSSFEISKV